MPVFMLTLHCVRGNALADKSDRKPNLDPHTKSHKFLMCVLEFNNSGTDITYFKETILGLV